MKSSNYKSSLILFLIYAVGMTVFALFIFYILYPANLPPVMFKFIPYPNFSIELIAIMVIIWPIAAIIGAFLAGFIFTPLFLFIHRRIIGRNMVYGIQLRKDRPEYSLRGILKSFFPALMAINFALLLNDNTAVIQLILTSAAASGGTYLTTFFPAFLVLLMFTIIIAMGSFSSIWFLYEARMVYSSEKADEEDTRVVEITSVGGFYNTALSGYAGIGAALSFYMFILLVIPELISTNIFILTVNIVIFMIFPLLIVLSSIPAMIILDRYKGIRNRFVLWLGRRQGIVDNVEVKLIKLDEEAVVKKLKPIEDENRDDEVEN